MKETTEIKYVPRFKINFCNVIQISNSLLLGNEMMIVLDYTFQLSNERLWVMKALSKNKNE